MKKITTLFTIAILSLFLNACEKQCDKPCDNNNKVIVATTITNKIPAPASIIFPEDFETGTKASYAAADITLKTGTWNLNDALLGTSASDRKNGLQSARVRNSGKLTMKFDTPNGASTVTVKHAKYGTDANGTWQLWYSTNGGTSYTQTGATITTSTTTLQTQTFTVNVAGNIRFDIRKTDGGSNRINFDDFSVTDYTAANPIPTLTTISPSSATAGGASFTLTAAGTNFISSSVISWNGAALTTTFINSTTLTAVIPTTNISTTGSASVTVFSPAPGGGTTTAATFTINPVVVSSGKKFLFDASHAETAGNADWVIDEDNNSPQRYPTPAQSTITSTTAETYWTGALSSWGIDLVKQGQTVETLHSGTAITWGNTSNTQDLSNYDVFVVDEPNTVFSATEKVAILNFVNHGGGLLMISDHTVSDRNNDGWDSPAIWNDLMSNNTLQTNPFGFTVDLANFSQVTSNVLSNSSNVLLHGSQGNVTQIQYNNGTTVTLTPSVNATVQGLIWKSSSTQGNTNVMCASSTYGTGRVFFVGDSSPMDDGTGAAGNNLFVSWSLYSHRNLFMNASMWLAKLQ